MPKKKRARVRAAASLRIKADALLQQITRAEHPYCEVCGKPSYCGHHFFPVSESSELRYDFKNIIPVCRGCHFLYHRTRPEMTIDTTDRRGRDWYDDLFARKRTLRKRNAPYYREVITELEA